MLSAVLLGMALLGAPATVPASADVAVVTPLPTPQFRRYGVAEGLPSTAVYAAVQDGQGTMWFATKGGLASFDGVAFKAYRHAAGTPGTLYGNNLSFLAIDRRDGSLWTGGLDAGLNRFDPASGTFRHWSHDAGDPHSLASDKVWAVAQDGDGSLWVGTVRGLDRLDAAGGFEHVVNPLLGSSPLDFGTVAALYVDGHDRLWVGSSQGVFRRDADGSFHAVKSADPKDFLDAWSIAGDGDEVRLSTAGGLFMVGVDGVARRFGEGVVPASNVMASARDADGRLWVGTKRGLYLQERRGGPFNAVMDRPVLYGNLPGSWIWQLYVDREGGLWVTLLDGGIGYLAPGWSSFSRFTHVPDDPASLRDAVATTMARGQDGRHVWVGEREGRVDRLDPATGTVEHVLDGLRGDVLGMTEDDRRRLWVAVQGGLYRVVDGRADRVDPQGRWLRHPLEVEAGPGGRLYVRTFGEGVFRVDPDTLAVTPVPMPRADERAVWGAQMTMGPDGTFWYASEGGMLRLDAAGQSLEPVPGGPQGRSVEAFDFAGDGLWMAGAESLEHYRYRQGVLSLDRVVDAAAGWPPVNVVDLRVDARGRVWIFGRDGLWRFDPADGSFRSFGLQDGLSDGEFSRGFATMPGGRVYAPTLGGVVSFDPDKVVEQRTVPQLALTEVDVRRGGLLQKLPLDGNEPLQVRWTDRSLRVAARVFSYADPAANRYRFRLEGFDNGWMDTGNRGEREFAALGAGNYTLRVMAAGANGVWTSLPRLRIRVQSPPWERWWAWLTYAAILALGIGLLFGSGRRRLAQRHRIQLVEQQRQMAEQASAVKTQFLATLSHELRTPMTGVMGMAELLLTTPLSSAQREYTQAMQRSGAMLLKLLNDSLDLARIESGRLELEPAPFDPRQLVVDVAQLETGQAQVKGLSFNVEIDDALPLRLVGDAMRIKQILFNLANNALKFTDYGGVTLRVERAEGGIRFSVRDTGPGIPEASRARLFSRFEQVDGPQRRVGSGLGLAICRELVQLMGGHIGFESQTGVGTTFHVLLPLREPEPLPLPEPLPEAAARQPLRVLLVEDDAIVAAVIRGLLQRQQHQVAYVPNGLAALAELEQSSCDAVLLDLDLPGVDGFRIAQLIRQRERPGQHLPIVAITARSGGDEEARARAAGMDGFLRKPLTGEQLAAALADVRRQVAAVRAEEAADPA